MLRSFSPGCSTKLWAVYGALAIASVSLVLVAGCASGAGGSPAQTLSGSAKVHTYNEPAVADVAARFFYSNVSDDQDTPWKEHRMVWSTDGTIPAAARGKIGFETAGAPTFTLSGSRSAGGGSSGTKYSKIEASASFYIVNNWDRAITITDATIPYTDFVYALPTGQQILDARLGGGATTMHDWLYGDTQVGYFREAAGVLFPSGNATPAATVQTDFTTALDACNATNGVAHPFITSGAPPVVTVPSETIPSEARSQGTGTVTLTFYAPAVHNQGQEPTVQATRMVALAFSTYFGVTVDFTYTP